MAINETDLCQCGHMAGDHHRSFFPGASDWYYEECEESSDVMIVDGKWVEHCFKYKGTTT